MKPWKQFKSHDRRISTDCVSIDEKLYYEIWQDAHFGSVDAGQYIDRLQRQIRNLQTKIKESKRE